MLVDEEVGEGEVLDDSVAKMVSTCGRACSRDGRVLLRIHSREAFMVPSIGLRACLILVVCKSNSEAKLSSSSAPTLEEIHNTHALRS